MVKGNLQAVTDLKEKELLKSMVGERGLEPPRPYGHYDLNVACLPDSSTRPLPLLFYDFLSQNTRLYVRGMWS